MSCILVIARRRLGERVRRTLTVAGHNVTVCHSLPEALATGPALAPHAIVLDGGTPGLESPPRLTEPLLPEYSVPILLLTRKLKPSAATARPPAGPATLEGPWTAEQLVAQIDTLLARGAQARESRVVSGPVRVDALNGTAYVDGLAVSLTPMQQRLLLYLIAHAGEVVTVDALLQRVWDYPAGAGSASLVRMHILNLRAKLEADPHNPRLIRTLPKRGYMWSP
ncbi:MAG: response regulator transcription factor [Chloroflexi bacterium]|nr:response regulator transcription factor [Chloroflexota bacterium]